MSGNHTIGPKLAAALVAAQKKARTLSFDSRNKFAKYDYVSAESMIKEAKECLAESGLCVIPGASTLTADSESGGKRTWILHRTFILIHESGECMTSEHSWVAQEAKGRPGEKAAAVADTSGLSYYLRTLLLIPRVDPKDNMDHDSHDRGREPKSDKDRRAAHDPSWESGGRERFCAAIAKLDSKLSYDDVADYCEAVGTPRPSALNEAKRNKFLDALKRGGDQKVAKFLERRK